MYPNNSATTLLKSSHKQRGSMLVIALFVIIVFGLLGITMTRVLSASSETIIYEVLGQRALNAARAGLQCNLAAKYPITGASAYCLNTSSYDLSAIGGLENCNYSVSSSDIAVIDSGTTFTYSKFVSTGSCQAGDIIVTRSLYVDSMEPSP